MLHLQCQLDWILNHLGDGGMPLCMCVCFQRQSGRPTTILSGTIPWTRGPDWIRGEREESQLRSGGPVSDFWPSRKWTTLLFYALSSIMAEAQQIRKTLEWDFWNGAPESSFILFVTEEKLTSIHWWTVCNCHFVGDINGTIINILNALFYQGALILGMYAKDSLHDSKFLYVENLISILGFFFWVTNQLPSSFETSY